MRGDDSWACKKYNLFQVLTIIGITLSKNSLTLNPETQR